MVRLPAGVRGMADRDEAWAAWVAHAAGVADALLAEWGLRQDGWAQHGYTALVLPVRDGDDRAGMLKIAFPDDESAYEHLALQKWQGEGAVRLLRADPRRRAMLLERLEDRTPRLPSTPSRPARSSPGSTAGCTCRLLLSCDLLSERAARWGSALRALPRERPGPAPAGRAGRLPGRGPGR